MRTAALALVLALVLALPAGVQATPDDGKVKYGGPTSIGKDKRRVSGSMNYGGPTDVTGSGQDRRRYNASDYDSDYVRGAPRKVGRYIGPLPPGQQPPADSVPSGYPPAPQGPRKVTRYIGPEPPADRKP